MFSVHKLFPGDKIKIDDAKTDRAYRLILKRTDNFNRDALRLLAKNPGSVFQSKKYLMNPKVTSGLSLPCRAILERYAVTDALAVQFQKKRRRTMTGLFTLAGLAVICLENYDGLAKELTALRYLLPMYLGLLGCAYLWHRLAGLREYQKKHLDYRALAEGLRVQFFWELAGINEDVSEHYLRKQRSELEWIRNAIHVCNLPAGGSGAAGEHRECRYWLVLRYWVNSQQRYYHGAAYRDERQAGRLELFMRVLIGFGIGLALTVAVIDAVIKLDLENPIHKIMRIMMQIAPALGAAFGGYAMKMALVEQVKRYGRMDDLYTQASQCLYGLIKHEDFRSAEQLLRELGDEALIENADWLFLHRERPMEVPLGG